MKKYLIFPVILITLDVSPVIAQVEKQVLPSELKQQTVITEPATLYKGFLRLGAYANYDYIDKVFNENGTKEYALNSNSWARSWNVNAVGQFGLTDRLQVGIILPYVIDRRFYASKLEDPLHDSAQYRSWNLKGMGLGDIQADIKYQILTEKQGRPALVGELLFIIPSGQKDIHDYKNNFDYKLPTGSGAMVASPSLLLRKVILPFSYTATMGYKYKFEGKKILQSGGEQVKFKNGDSFFLGGSFNFHLNDWIALQNGINYENIASDIIAGESSNNEAWAIQYQPSINFQLKRFRLVELTIFTFAGKNTGADPGYFIILQYIL